jgi:hypothetical protein
MIHDVDASLRELIEQEALADAQVEVVFDAPTTGWAAKRTGPVIDVFLYDLREDVTRREAQVRPAKDHNGRITGRQRGVRFFRMSYLLTAWTARPVDEHRLLGRLLEALIEHDQIPGRHLQGRLAGRAVPFTVALPAPDRSLSDLWSALGGEMKPSLDLVLTVPVEPTRTYEVGEPVLHRPEITVLRKAPDEIGVPRKAPGENGVPRKAPDENGVPRKAPDEVTT